MPNRPAVPITPERSSAILAEAMRRIDAAIPDHAVDLHALRQALETEQAKGPSPLVKLMKIGRRRALDRIGRAERKQAEKDRTKTWGGLTENRRIGARSLPEG